MELDLHGVRDHAAAKSHEPARTPAIQRRSSFKEIQSALSRIKPEILKNVIGTSGDYAAKRNVDAVLPSPAATATSKCVGVDTAPLTIFYGGKVVVVDLTPDKAKSILSLAEKASGDGSGELAVASDMPEEKDCIHVFAKVEGGGGPAAKVHAKQKEKVNNTLSLYEQKEEAYICGLKKQMGTP